MIRALGSEKTVSSRYFMLVNMKVKVMWLLRVQTVTIIILYGFTGGLGWNEAGKCRWDDSGARRGPTAVPTLGE